MKAVGFLALLLGLVAAGACLFSLAVTHPEYERAKADQSGMRGSLVGQTDYSDQISTGRKALDIQHYVAWGAGGLGVLLGLLCMGQRRKMIPLVGMLVAAAAVAGTFLSQT